MNHTPITDLFESYIDSPDGGINPPISDSSTFFFDDADHMHRFMEGEVEDRFIYARHLTPSTVRLGRALAILEETPAALVTNCGMSAISSSILQICSAGDEILSSRMIYGGTYALFQSILPRFGVRIKFLDLDDMEAVEKAITPQTRLIYCESMSNPLLEVPDLRGLAEIANAHDLKLMVDNTFTPLILTPSRLGAHIVVDALTKFINGMGDGLGGAICASREFIMELLSITSGAYLIMGNYMDSLRAASIYKNLQTLHLRLQKHSSNAQFIAERLEESGIRVFYPGLPSHRHHERLKGMMNQGFGYGGMLVLDAGEAAIANQLVARMQEAHIGHVAVSLGCYRTLFTLPGSSTSAEISPEEQQSLGLSPGLIRFSMGIDPDPEWVLSRLQRCFKECGRERTSLAYD